MSVGSWLVLGCTLEAGAVAGVVWLGWRMFPARRQRRAQIVLEATVVPPIGSRPAAPGVRPVIGSAADDDDVDWSSWREPPRVLEGKVIERGRIGR